MASHVFITSVVDVVAHRRVCFAPLMLRIVALVVVLLFAVHAAAYDQPFKPIEGGKWDLSGGPIKLVIDPDGSDDIPDDDSERAAIELAVRGWACQPDTTLKAEFLAEPGPKFTDLSDGKNTFFWDETGDLCMMGPGTLGINIGSVTGIRTESDICFNGRDSQWGTPTKPGPTDITAIALHEFGHFIGLDHPCDGDAPNESNCNGGDVSVMTPAWDGTLQQEPKADDLEGLYSLYPGDNSGGACTGPFTAGERCDCNGACVNGLLCIPDPTGQGRCGAPCSSNPVAGDAANYPGPECGTTSVCVFSPLEAGAPAAKGACVEKVPQQLPPGAQCLRSDDCAKGTCVANIDFGRSICQFTCDADADCAEVGGKCVNSGSAKLCLNAELGIPCPDPPVEEEPGCQCTSRRASPSVPFAGLVVAASLALASRRRKLL
jgi:MYXO-CTERM domain-containing protein